jgi:hypothetical protein
VSKHNYRSHHIRHRSIQANNPPNCNANANPVFKSEQQRFQLMAMEDRSKYEAQKRRENETRLFSQDGMSPNQQHSYVLSNWILIILAGIGFGAYEAFLHVYHWVAALIG